MLPSEPIEPARGTDLAQLPEFQLEYYLDDVDGQTTVTICSAESGGHLATEWIATEADNAVSLEDVR